MQTDNSLHNGQSETGTGDVLIFFATKKAFENTAAVGLINACAGIAYSYLYVVIFAIEGDSHLAMLWAITNGIINEIAQHDLYAGDIAGHHNGVIGNQTNINQFLVCERF